jgi:glycosyltransferase involved in cell wall biosynthesis
VFHLITTINRGGAENQLLILAKEQVKQGFEVHVVYLKGEPELETEFNIIGARLHHDLAKQHPIFQPFTLRKIIGGEYPIVHAHLPRAELISFFTPKKFKFVTSRHNAEPFFPGAPKFVSNFLARLVGVRASKIIAISEAVENYLYSRGEVRNRNKIEVILYGYQTYFSRGEVESKSRSSITRIGTISRLSDQKDIPTMLLAFKDFRINHPTATLSILGSGPLENHLKELVRREDLEPWVIFNGRSSKVYEFLYDLDVFILTSKYEGFGMVLLEAMDAGVPIIASNNSAIPEVLGKGFSGLCKSGDPGDFATKLEAVCDSKFRLTILDQQKSRIKLFDSEIMCKKVNEVYLL